MKYINGIWLNDECKTTWLESPMINGLPAYQYDDIQEILEACGDRRGVCVDGGANVGVWTVHLMRYFHRVIAFEPIPHIYECLEKNVAAYSPDRGSPKQTEILRVALSDHDGTVPMTPRSGLGWAVHPHSKSKAKPTEMHCLKLDSLGLQRLDLLKLDLEGHEYEALQGAMKTIERCKPVVVVEEKLDKMQRSVGLLLSLGMECVGVYNKHDFLFVWP